MRRIACLFWAMALRHTLRADNGVLSGNVEDTSGVPGHLLTAMSKAAFSSLARLGWHVAKCIYVSALYMQRAAKCILNVA